MSTELSKENLELRSWYMNIQISILDIHGKDTDRTKIHICTRLFGEEYPAITG